MRDVDELEVGMITDIIITYNNLNDDNSNETRNATQKDFDNF
jgi:hypothetical protein